MTASRDATRVDVDPPVEVANADTLRERIAQSIDTLEDAASRWDELTTAQKFTAMRVAVRTVARIARLILDRLEASP